MKLTYRGISYNQPENQVTTTSGAVMGKYRGTAWVARMVLKFHHFLRTICLDIGLELG